MTRRDGHVCQSTVYVVHGEREELLMEDAARIEIDGDSIEMRSLFGEPMSLQARVMEIDLIKNRIILERRAGPSG